MGQFTALYSTLETARVADDPKRGLPIILSALKLAAKWNRLAISKTFAAQESPPEVALFRPPLTRVSDYAVWLMNGGPSFLPRSENLSREID